MTQQTEELDLWGVIRTLHHCFAKQFYKTIRFFWKSKFYIIGLIIVGAILGKITQKESYKADIVVKINFGTQAYVYNAITQLDDYVETQNPTFLEEMGLNKDSLFITSIGIKPYPDIVNLIDEIELNERSFQAILDEITVERGESLIESIPFLPSYSYHRIQLKFNDKEGYKQVQMILDYINEQEYLIALSEQEIESDKASVAELEKMIAQSDKAIEAYTNSLMMDADAATDLTFYNNQGAMDLREIFNLKTFAIKELKDIKKDLVKLNRPVTLISSIALVKEAGLFKNNLIMYPLVLVFLFVMAAALLNYYKFSKGVAETEA